MESKINLAEALLTFDDRWSPKIVAQLNDYDVQVVKVKGEFVWHKHDETDDFFLALKGHLTIQLRDRNVELDEGELFVVPRGVEHCPLRLRLGFPDAGNDRSGTTTRAASELVSEGFGPGANGTLLLAAELSGPDDRAAVERVAADVRKAPGVAAVSPPRINPDGDAAVIRVQPATAPQDSETTDLVHRLRNDVVPAATRGTDTQVDVGGLNAVFVDQSDQVSSRLPLFVAAVVGLSFLLLTAAFRAPLIALKAGVMNLLSIGAAYGVVALVAQGGFAGSLIGIDTNTPVPPFIPVMMFAILFGLSMDYEVFLLSRVREEYLGNGSTSQAVAHGLAKTARVITAAAAIMVAVFMSFVLSTETFLKLMGVGMATAILVDATIVRMVSCPR